MRRIVGGTLALLALWQLAVFVLGAAAAASVGQTAVMPPAAFEDPSLRSLVQATQAEDGDDAARQGTAICRIADQRVEAKQKSEAALLFQLVSDRYPQGAEWGRATFNAGYLWRELGHPRIAIETLLRVFDSSVNDRDPGPDLMTAYRNYRQRSAVEIAECYNDLLHYPRAYWWEAKAATKYTYRSWCGTCTWEARRAETRRMLLASLAAGPAFVAGNLLFFPLRNWRAWLVLGGVWLVGRFAGRGAGKDPSSGRKTICEGLCAWHVGTRALRPARRRPATTPHA